jgi:hypothetical protein
MRGVRHLLVLLSVAVLFTACGPSVRDPGEDDDGDDTAEGPDAGEYVCTPSGTTETSCDDDFDDDCDNLWNCSDPDCSGVGDCPVCGEAVHTEGSPLALPDDGSCSIHYSSTINITGFPVGQVLEALDDFLGVCVTMEHSWLRDLRIYLTNPEGTQIMLQEFLGTTGSEVFMGQPYEDDEGGTPVPGVGAEYCWTPTAYNAPTLDYCNANPSVHDLPPADYQASSGFGGLVGESLRGAWTITVEDCWGIDNGFIFDWSVVFSPDLVNDCSEPIG